MRTVWRMCILMLGCKRLSQPELVPISKATKRVVTPPTWTPCPEQVTQSSLSNLSGFLSCAALVTFCFLWRRETLRVKCFTKEHSNLFNVSVMDRTAVTISVQPIIWDHFVVRVTVLRFTVVGSFVTFSLSACRECNWRLCPEKGPLTPNSDSHLISPHNIIPESHIKVRRIKKTITIQRSS